MEEEGQVIETTPASKPFFFCGCDVGIFTLYAKSMRTEIKTITPLCGISYKSDPPPPHPPTSNSHPLTMYYALLGKPLQYHANSFPCDMIYEFVTKNNLSPSFPIESDPFYVITTLSNTQTKVRIQTADKGCI